MSSQNLIKVHRKIPLYGLLIQKNYLYVFKNLNSRYNYSLLSNKLNFNNDKISLSSLSNSRNSLINNNNRFFHFSDNKYLKLKNILNRNNFKIINLKFGITVTLISLLIYLLNTLKENKIKCKMNDSTSNIITKYIINIVNDPKIEDSVKKLLKKIMINLIKDDEFTKDWRICLRNVIKECEEEIGQNFTNILKTKIVQDWLYSTTNEIVDYMSKTPEIISKTSTLFSDAINHNIFTENSKQWLEEFIQNCIINNNKIIQAINQLLVGIFSTKDIQNNLSNLLRQVILNNNTQEYMSLAFWNVFKNSIIFPKNWFNNIKSKESSQNINKVQSN